MLCELIHCLCTFWSVHRLSFITLWISTKVVLHTHYLFLYMLIPVVASSRGSNWVWLGGQLYTGHICRHAIPMHTNIKPIPQRYLAGESSQNCKCIWFNFYSDPFTVHRHSHIHTHCRLIQNTKEEEGHLEMLPFLRIEAVMESVVGNELWLCQTQQACDHISMGRNILCSCTLQKCSC